MLALSLLLTGCAGITPSTAPEVSATAQQNAAPRSYRDTIDLSGRLSVHYQQDGKDEAMHGSFTWTQDPQHSTVTLLSPLGQTLATIEVTPGASTLTQAGQAPRMAADVDALAAEALGWPLPVAGLRHWLQGFAIDADGRSVIAMPQSTADTITTRDGWRIRYASWQEDRRLPAQHRPQRIDLERNSAQAGNVALRIVIDDWQAR